MKQKVEKQKNKTKQILLNENKRIKGLQMAFASYMNSAELAEDLETVDIEEKAVTTAK